MASLWAALEIHVHNPRAKDDRVQAAKLGAFLSKGFDRIVRRHVELLDLDCGLGVGLCQRCSSLLASCDRSRGDDEVRKALREHDASALEAYACVATGNDSSLACQSDMIELWLGIGPQLMLGEDAGEGIVAGRYGERRPRECAVL